MVGGSHACRIRFRGRPWAPPQRPRFRPVSSPQHTSPDGHVALRLGAPLPSRDKGEDLVVDALLRAADPRIRELGTDDKAAVELARRQIAPEYDRLNPHRDQVVF